MDTLVTNLQSLGKVTLFGVLFGAGLPLLQRLSRAGVLMEIATLEGVAGIEQLLARAPAARLCFGSHSPYFYFEAALLKLQESALEQLVKTGLRSLGSGDLRSGQRSP